MSNKFSYLLASIVTCYALTGVSPVGAQSSGGITPSDLKDTAELAAALQNTNSAKPIILNIGSAEQIKGATLIGPAGKAKGMAELKDQLAKLPKDKEIIIYCGCCPLGRCPNVQPAFALFKKNQFTKAKVLQLPTNLTEDWVAKGYPMEQTPVSGKAAAGSGTAAHAAGS